MLWWFTKTDWDDVLGNYGQEPSARENLKADLAKLSPMQVEAKYIDGTERLRIGVYSPDEDSPKIAKRYIRRATEKAKWRERTFVGIVGILVGLLLQWTPSIIRCVN